jgi:hypothetical protein
VSDWGSARGKFRPVTLSNQRRPTIPNPNRTTISFRLFKAGQLQDSCPQPLSLLKCRATDPVNQDRPQPNKVNVQARSKPIFESTSSISTGDSASFAIELDKALSQAFDHVLQLNQFNIQREAHRHRGSVMTLSVGMRANHVDACSCPADPGPSKIAWGLKSASPPGWLSSECRNLTMSKKN